MFRLRKVASPDVEIPRGKRLIRAKDWLLYLQARSILRECREAVLHANEEVNRAYEQEKERGYQEGMQSGKEDMLVQMHQFSAMMQDHVRSIEDGVTDLVLELVGKIIISIPEPERAALMIQKALVHMHEREQLHVMVAPEHVEHVRRRMEEMHHEFGGRNEIKVTGNPTLAGDECVVEGGGLVIEVSLKNHLEALQRSLEPA